MSKSKKSALVGGTVATHGAVAGSVGQSVAVAVGVPIAKFTNADSAAVELRAIGEGFAKSHRATVDAEGPLRIRFADACEALGVPITGEGDAARYDKDSEAGKAVSKFLRDGALDAIRQDRGYDLMVHRVGAEDKYLPVAVWSTLAQRFVPVADAPVANFAITAALALDGDLKKMEGQALAPYGMKAWLRGGLSGPRPDGVTKGMRDSLMNVADQCVSRAWRDTMPGGGSAPRVPRDLEAWLKDTVKVLESRVKSYHKENGDDACATIAEAKAAWERMAREVLKS